MDKNVSSVNLDELKAAREALDKERGLETDPNMYNDYDPEKHKAEREQEKLARENASNYEEVDVSSSESNEESITISAEPTLESNSDLEIDLSGDDDEIIINQTNESAEDVDSFEPVTEVENAISREFETSQEKPEVQDTDDGEVNLNIYDTFADFEVNSEKPSIVSPVEDIVKPAEEVVEQKFEESNAEDDEEEKFDSSSLDDFLKDLDAILSSDTSDDDKIITDIEEEKEEPVMVYNEIPDEVKSEVQESTEELNESASGIDDFLENFKVEDVDSSLEETQETEEIEEVEEIVQENDDSTKLLEDKPLTVETDSANDDIFAFSNYENLVDAEPTMNAVEENEYNTEVLSDFSKLSTMADEMEEEMNRATQIENAEDVQNDTEEVEDVAQEEPESVYQKIESFNFIDVISTDEFKDEDKFSYLLGKNEDGELVFGHLKDTCGTAVFTRNEDAVFSGFSSILLSLLLKNTPEEMQFVVCDAMFDSEFDVFENSSYMYFNRVAKNNREIVDTLIELSKEIEARYNNLVYAGVKSISSYNLQMEERGSKKMPYIVVFINNYAKMSQFLDNERINTCIYNILKFGRLVGVYVVLASAGEIERREINHNLPTRIAYKTEDELESVRSIGSEGAENLVDENDFLYSTIYDEEVKHLKVANLTKKEIELVIENLEN